MKGFIKFICVSLVTLFIIVTGLMFFALSSKPLPLNQPIINADVAAQSKRVLRRAARVIKSDKPTVNLVFTQQELHGLSALAHRAFPHISSEITLGQKGSDYALSVKLPLPEFIGYLNIQGTLLPSKQGLNFAEITIGSLRFSAQKLLTVVAWLADRFVQNNLGTVLIELTQQVVMRESHIIFTVKMPEQLLIQDVSGRSRLVQLRDELALFGDVDVIRFYYQAIVNLTQRQNNHEDLTPYLNELFSLASIRVENDIGSAATENQAALTALVLYFGSDRFELLIGDIAQLNKEQQTTRYTLRAKTTIADRVDLQQHFIYSIALQLFSNTGASDALGEAKEFLDSNQGGSGFSFADLLADRAGTRLAQLATMSDESALYILARLTNIQQESEFIPSIDDLPEGLSADIFEQRYKNANSAIYKDMLNAIDSKLTQLPLYQVLED